MKNLNEKVLERLPKKYHKHFGSLSPEPDLIDDCPYMLYFAEGYAWLGEYPSLPVKSISEAIIYLKEGDIDKYYSDEQLKKLGVI